jgi:hypothetical protein
MNKTERCQIWNLKGAFSQIITVGVATMRCRDNMSECVSSLVVEASRIAACANPKRIEH